MKKQDRKQNRDRDAELVDRCDLRNAPKLKRPEIEQPGQPRRKAGENQKKPVLRADLTNLTARAGEQDDTPGKRQNDSGPDRCRQIRVDIAHARFRQKRRHRREECGKQCADSPVHDDPRRPFL